MDTAVSKHIWIHGYDMNDIALLTTSLEGPNQLIGSSHSSPSHSVFPQGGLIPALRAAMRGEFHALLVRDETLLGANLTQRKETIALFRAYGVLVKSCSSSSSSSS